MKAPWVVRVVLSGALLSVAGMCAGTFAWADDDNHGLPVVEESYSVSPQEALPGGRVTTKVTCLFNGVPCTYLLIGLYSTTDNSENGVHYFETPDHPFDKNGKFEHVFTIPHDVPPGTYEFEFMPAADDMALKGKEFDFTVLDPDGEELAETGWYPGRKRTAAGAALVILLGGALMLAAHRPRPYASRIACTSITTTVTLSRPELSSALCTSNRAASSTSPAPPR